MTINIWVCLILNVNVWVMLRVCLYDLYQWAGSEAESGVVGVANRVFQNRCKWPFYSLECSWISSWISARARISLHWHSSDHEDLNAFHIKSTRTWRKDLWTSWAGKTKICSTPMWNSRKLVSGIYTQVIDLSTIDRISDRYARDLRTCQGARGGAHARHSLLSNFFKFL